VKFAKRRSHPSKVAQSNDKPLCIHRAAGGLAARLAME
jgi:hypothetical protein